METLWRPYYGEMAAEGESPGCSAVGASWDIASAVLAEKLHNVVRVCVGIARLNGKLLWRKRRSDYEEYTFQVRFSGIRLFMTIGMENVGEEFY